MAISHFVSSDIKAHFPQAAPKLSVIYNGADRLIAPEGHKPAYLPESPFLFAIGILSPKKNFHVLPALLQKNDFRLVISGIVLEDYKQKLLSEAERLGVKDRIIITGPVSDLDKAWYYRHCTAFVFPSLAEGFGLPVIEAMYHGQPVFLSKKTSLPEIGGDAAYYFDHFDPEHMHQVFTDGLRHFQSNNLHERVVSHASQFTWGNTANEYLQLYKLLLK